MKAEPGEPVKSIELEERIPLKRVNIGVNIKPHLKLKLIHLLREYADVFAWTPEDMSGLHESIAVHELYLEPNKIAVKEEEKLLPLRDNGL